jgi:arylformamidase
MKNFIIGDIMTIYDISVPIGAETPLYPGDPPVGIAPLSCTAKGDKYNLSVLSFGSHCGTHIDAPYHLDPDGKRTDQLPLELFVGTAQVVEAAAKDGYVTRDELVRKVQEGNTDRLLIKTSNSNLWQQKEFVKDYVYLSKEAAKWAVEAGIKLVGIDYLSVERFDSPDFAVHRTLLDNSVVILEGLDLSKVSPGVYQLICLPLKIKDCDGAPVRAVLMTA